MQNPTTTLAINTLEHYESLGIIVCLMKQSEYHSQWPLWNIDSEILPSLYCGQIKIYFQESNPIGFVSWAWLDEQSLHQKIKDDEALSIEQWRTGNRLFFNDFVAPWGHAIQIFNDLKNNVFPEVDSAGSIRRKNDGSIRVINSWQRNRQKRTLKNSANTPREKCARRMPPSGGPYQP